MGVNALAEQLRQVLARHLGGEARYRCMILQTPNLALMEELQQSLAIIFEDRNEAFAPIAAIELFDDVGAIACRDLTNRIGNECGEKGMVLRGPLNFLDYWSTQVRSGFWTYLAAIMRGPGIVVIDSPRDELPEGFRVVDRFNGMDIKVLKSRLALTRGHIA